MTVDQMRRLRARCPRWDAIVTEAEVGQAWAMLVASCCQFTATHTPLPGGLTEIVVRVNGQLMPCREEETR